MNIKISPMKAFLITFITGLLIVIEGTCYGQTPNYVKLKSFEPGAPGSLIGVNSSSTAVYTNTVSTLTATSVISAQSFSASGTAGTGFIYLRGQSSTPTAPTTVGGNLFFNSSGNFAWNRKPSLGNDTFVRGFSGIITADRFYVLPDKAGTVALTSDIPTYTVTAPLTLITSTFGITQAGASSNGYLNSTDWNTFNGKQNALGYTPEDQANKATSFGTLSNTLYPTTQAVSNYVTGFNYLPSTTSLTINGITKTFTSTPAFTVGDALVANPLSQFSATSSSQLLGVISDETGTGSLVFNSAPTFTNGILVNDGTVAGGVKIGARVGSTANGAIYMGMTTPSSTNYAMYGNSSSTILNNPTSLALAVNDASKMTLTGSLVTMTDAVNFVFGTTTGTKFGTATTQKIGFFNATPIVQPGATAEIGSVLNTLGLRASGSAWTISTTGTAAVGTTSVTGNLTLTTLGNGLIVKGGTNSRIGTATLVAGTVTVANTSVTANTRIFVTVQSLGTVSVMQAVGVTARVNGTSFTITSANVTDTSVISWFLIEEN